MKLILKSAFCRKKNCPKLYRDSDGTFYVQGYIVTDPNTKVKGIPKNETLVRIDSSLVEQIKKNEIA